MYSPHSQVSWFHCLRALVWPVARSQRFGCRDGAVASDKTSIQSHLCLVHFFRHLFRAFLFIYFYVFRVIVMHPHSLSLPVCRSFHCQHFISPLKIIEKKIASSFELDEFRTVYCECSKKLLWDAEGEASIFWLSFWKVDEFAECHLFSCSLRRNRLQFNETCRSLHQMSNVRFTNECVHVERKRWV